MDNGQYKTYMTFAIRLIQKTCIVKFEAKVWSSDGTIVGFSFEGSHYGFNVRTKRLMHLVACYSHQLHEKTF